MNAGTAGHVGIQKLKQLNMVNIDMFRHPKYYKELRKLRNKLDQVISSKRRDGACERAPGPGLKPQATNDTTTSGLKLQATSSRLQAPSSDKKE